LGPPFSRFVVAVDNAISVHFSGLDWGQDPIFDDHWDMTTTTRRTMRTTRAREQAGFTLIELLVVILVIGILAAIALPSFLGQRSKAQDSTAKSNARNMVSQIEACYHAAGGYLGCTAELSTAATGLDVGSTPGQVRIVTETATGYEISAVSPAETAAVNHTFTIIHNLGGVFDHDCTVRGEGGCPDDGEW